MRYFLVLFFLCSHSYGQLPPGPLYYWNVNKASKYIEQDKASEALQVLVKQLEDHPFDIYLMYNLGVSFQAMKNEAKAQGVFKDLDKLLEGVSDTEQLDRIKKIHYYFLFNLGNLAATQKKRNEAIEYYQKALDIYPQSRGAKTNIELLVKSQSGGGGEGEDKKEKQNSEQKKDKQNKKDQKDQNKQDQKKQDQKKQYQNPKPKPKPFKSKELSKDDVRRILEELKRQEGKIWNRMNEKPQEQQLEKDW